MERLSATLSNLSDSNKLTESEREELARDTQYNDVENKIVSLGNKPTDDQVNKGIRHIYYQVSLATQMEPHCEKVVVTVGGVRGEIIVPPWRTKTGKPNKNPVPMISGKSDRSDAWKNGAFGLIFKDENAGTDEVGDGDRIGEDDYD